MGWDDAEKELSKSGKFLKLKDGESIEVVFVGQPHTFYQAYKDPNEYQEWKEGRSFKFRINVAVYNKEDDSFKIGLWQQSKTFLKALVEAKKEYGMDCLYKIKRSGATKDDTTYHVLFKAKLAPTQLKSVNMLDTLPLTGGNSRKDAPDIGEESQIDPRDEEKTQKQEDRAAMSGRPIDPTKDIPF